MYGHYNYGSHHNVGGSSSQPNVGGSSSAVRHFSLDNDDDFTQMYSPQFLESFREEQSPVEEIEEIQVPEETALCKGWVRISKDSVKGNMRKEKGFWIEILKYMQETYPITQRRTYDMVNGKWKTVRSKVCTFCGVYAYTIRTYTSGASNANYLQRALIDYQAEYGVSFTLLHCWEVLKESEKWRSGEVPLFMQEREDGKNKRYKSSDSSSFNTKESGEESINLNTTVGDEAENEVEDVRRPKPMGRDQAKRKMKAGSASSASSFDVEALAKMIASEYELELKAAELEIRRMKNSQRDKALYETTTDEALRERVRQRLFS
ncbi:RNA-directed DNA polymerase, eukaryota [Tanacetum coccineum]